MGKIHSIEKDEVIYCRHIGNNVNIHELTHPVLNKTYCKVCDNASRCNCNGCKYKPGNC